MNAAVLVTRHVKHVVDNTCVDPYDTNGTMILLDSGPVTYNGVPYIVVPFCRRIGRMLHPPEDASYTGRNALALAAFRTVSKLQLR